MMAKSGYPKRFGPSPLQDGGWIIGLAGILAFMIAFACAWFEPILIPALLAGPVFTLLIDRKNWRHRLSMVLFQVAIIVTASLAVWLIK
ncbi:MAG: hypothetical protein WA985_09615 [Erythrobacter sp.]